MKHLVAALLLLGAFSIGCTKDNHPPEPGTTAVSGGNAPATAPTTAGAASAGSSTVVATINGQPVTQKDLDDSMTLEETKKIFEVRDRALQALIIKKLVDAEAKKDNKTEDQWLKEKVENSVPPATEAEAKEFFDKHSAEMPPGQTFDTIKSNLMGYLTGQKRQEAAIKLFEKLKQDAKVEVKLEEPEEPVQQVEAKGPSKGPETAPITIVEFSDFQCPYCSKVEPTITRVMADYAGKVRFVFRDYPLPFHEHAEKAAEASHCAEDQGKYWEMHDAMFNHQDKLAIDDLKKLSKEAGLDDKKFAECLDSGKMKAKVDENADAGSKVGVNGTPHFFINGHPLSGAVPYEQFKKVIDKELAKVAQK
jgi:protein-disulfide isomerase